MKKQANNSPSSKKATPKYYQIPSKENFSSFLCSFLEDKSEIHSRSILTVIEILNQIDLTKANSSNLQTSTSLYVFCLQKAMNLIDKKKVIFSIPSIISIAEMLSKLFKHPYKSNPIDLGQLIQSLFQDREMRYVQISKSSSLSFHTRKPPKVHGFKSFFAFINRHYPQINKIKDIFAYAFLVMLQNLNRSDLANSLLHDYVISTSLKTAPPIDISQLSTEYLDKLIPTIKPQFDSLTMILVQFLISKMFGISNDNLVQVDELFDIILTFLEDDPENVNIDQYIPLFLYYKSTKVSYPVHFTYFPTHQFQFLICLGLTDQFEGTTRDILLSSISFEQFSEPALALVYSFDLTEPFLVEFVKNALSNTSLNPEWKEELTYLKQYIKFPPDINELIEQSKSNNIEAIKFLLKDPKCLEFLKPNEFESHKLIEAFLKPLPETLPAHITECHRITAILFYRLLTTKNKAMTKLQAIDYIEDIWNCLSTITLSYCNKDKTLFHLIYSGINPAPQANQYPFKKINAPVDFFTNNPANQFEDIGIIIDTLLSLMVTLNFNYSEDQNMKKYQWMIADFEQHYALSIPKTKRGVQLFGSLYQPSFDMQPFVHLFKILQINGNSDVLRFYKPLLINCKPITSISLIQQFYQLKKPNVLAQIMQLIPQLPSIPPNSFSDDELLDIASIILSAGNSKNLLNIIAKLIQTQHKEKLFELLYHQSQTHAYTISSILKDFPEISEFASYFFSHFDSYPQDINPDMASLLLQLSALIKQSTSTQPIPNIRAKINNNWPEDKKQNETQINQNELNQNEQTQNEQAQNDQINDDNQNDDIVEDVDALERIHREFEMELIHDRMRRDNPRMHSFLHRYHHAAKDDHYNVNDKKIRISTPDDPSIWEIDDNGHCTFLDTGKAYVDQPFFRCLTCNFQSNEGCCEYCATHCHKGHLLTFDRVTSCYCDCFNYPKLCQCNPKNDFHKEENHLQVNSKDLIDLDQTKIIDYYLKIAKSKFILLTKEEILRMPLRIHQCVDNPGFLASTTSFSIPNLTSVNSLRRSLNGSSSLQNSYKHYSIRPFTLCCYCGNKMACYYTTQHTVQLFQVDQNQSQSTDTFMRNQFGSSSISTSNIMYNIVPSGGSYVACIYDNFLRLKKIEARQQTDPNEIRELNDQIRTLERSIRDTLNSDRNDLNQTFQQLSQLKQTLSNQQNNLPYELTDSLEYQMPVQSIASFFLDCIFIEDKLVVALGTTFLAVYNMTSTNALSVIKPAENESFTSFTLINKNHFAAGMNNGNLSIYELNSKNELNLVKAIKISNKPLYVSSSHNEFEYFFIGCENQEVEMCKTNELFNDFQNFVPIKCLNGPFQLTSEAKVNEKTLLLFTNAMNGSIISIEFREEAIYYSRGERFTDNRGTLTDLHPAMLGSFFADGILFTLMNDSRFCKVTFNGTPNTRSDRNQFKSFAPFGLEAKPAVDEVPITFWSKTIINPDEISIDSNEFPDADNLLHSFNESPLPPNREIEFTVSVDTPSLTIVGIRLFADSPTNNPPTIRFQNRIYPMSRSRNLPTYLPLKPTEVNPGHSVCFTILPTTSITLLRAINVHCMDTYELTVPPETKVQSAQPISFNWVSESTSLFTFSTNSLKDVPENDKRAQIELKLANALNYNTEFTNQQLHDLIVVMYSNDNISLTCRLIISKLKLNDVDAAQKIWTDAIKEVVENQLICKSQIEYLWRDYSLLNDKYKSTIKDLLWSKLAQNGDAYCLISAFY